MDQPGTPWMFAAGWLWDCSFCSLHRLPDPRLIMFSTLIIFFLVVEPEGLNRLWRNIRNSFRIWLCAY